MTPEQLASLRLTPAEPGIKGRDLADAKDRTLLYGYTRERLTCHVYLQARVIHQLEYTNLRGTHARPSGFQHVSVRHRDETSEYFGSDPSLWLPDKRVYPELCDYDFCKQLTRAGVEIPFTAFGCIDQAENRGIPTHLDMPPVETARMSDALHIAGIEKGSAYYRALYTDQALFQRIVGRYHFNDVGAEPATWIILEDDIEALAKEIVELTERPSVHG